MLPALSASYIESEVSVQLQRFFSRTLNLHEEIKMRSVVVSCWDDGIREAFLKGARDLERSWRYGIPFTF